MEIYLILISPKKVGTTIKLTGSATGSGPVKYSFVAIKNSITTVIQYYKTTNEATWTPTKVGTYTIYTDVKDTTGTIVSQKVIYVIFGNI